MSDAPDANSSEATDANSSEATDANSSETPDADGGEARIRRAGEVEYEAVDAADGLHKGVLIGPEQGAPTLAFRRFTLDPGGEVPKHTNAIEHEQYVLEGEYVVGIDDEEHTVSAGDSLHIPAGTVHWYRNEREEPGAFICAVPVGDDEIQVLEA